MPCRTTPARDSARAEAVRLPRRRPSAGGGFSGLPATDDGEFEEFESGGGFRFGPVRIRRGSAFDGIAGEDGGFEIASGGTVGESALDFIPSSDEAEQQRFDHGAGASRVHRSRCPLRGGYVAALLGRALRGGGRAPRPRTDPLRRLPADAGQRFVGEPAAACFPSGSVLSGDEYALLEENAVEFAALGFDIGFCGDGAVEVKGTPADTAARCGGQAAFRAVAGFSRRPLSVADVRREKVAAVMARGAARKHAARVVARRGRGAARAAGRDGQRQLLALGQGDHRRRSRPKSCARSWDNGERSLYLHPYRCGPGRPQKAKLKNG